MNNLNSILLEGNLVGDPDLTSTPEGTTICRFSISCTRFHKRDDLCQEEVSTFAVTVRDKLAEICKENLKKDKGVRVVGRLKEDLITDDNGKSKSKVYIVAEHIDFKPVVS
jgi:single-strand DNA-binding protein